jgi:hypothetical protein
MNPQQKLWLKVAATILFTALEIDTFGHTVIPAFAQATPPHIILAAGSQLSFAIGLFGLWFGRTRIWEEAGWTSLVLFVLITLMIGYA